jgi:hypothetical protein
VGKMLHTVTNIGSGGNNSNNNNNNNNNNNIFFKYLLIQHYIPLSQWLVNGYSA